MIQFRRGTASAASTANEVLAAGQPFVETDTSKLKIGDGSTAFNDLPYIGGSGGKKYATVVVGTSTAGYTADQVDFLCDGVDDQVELNMAFDQIKQIGGYIKILDGVYNLSDRFGTSVSGWDSHYVKIGGSGSSTILNAQFPSTSENFMLLYLLRNDYEICNMTIQVTEADNGVRTVLYGNGYIHDCTFVSRNNSNTSFEFIARGSGYCRLINNVFDYGNSSAFVNSAIIDTEAYSIISQNKFTISSYVDTVIRTDNFSTVSNNIIEGEFTTAISGGGTGNGLKFGSITCNCIDCSYSPESAPNVNATALISAGSGITVLANSINIQSPNLAGISVTQMNAGDSTGVAIGNVVYGGYDGIRTDDNMIIIGNCLANQSNSSVTGRSYLAPEYAIFLGNRTGLSLDNMDGTGVINVNNLVRESFE